MGWFSSLLSRRTAPPPGFTISSPPSPVNDASEFVTDPVSYLSRNLLIVKPSSRQGDLTSVNRRPVDVLLISRGAKTGTGTWNGEPMDVLAVVPLTDFNCERGYMGLPRCDPFKAYICPYQNNKALGVMISNGADFVFTDQMDGCSFGVGSVASDGSRLVYHANSMTLHKKQGLSQAGKQAKMLAKKLKSGADLVFEPADYRGSGECSSTTIGIRDPERNTWSFYAQIYTTLSMAPVRYELLDLMTLL